MLESALSGKQLLDKQLLDDLLETMQLGSLCALGGGVPLPITNILTYFTDEISPFFSQKLISTQGGA
jgi:NADH-quinone oxidoreductase subunit F